MKASSASEKGRNRGSLRSGQAAQSTKGTISPRKLTQVNADAALRFHNAPPANTEPGALHLSITCLILEPEAIVAEDLSILVRECRPDARCLIARNEAEAQAMLQQAGTLDVAFLNLRPSQIAEGTLAAALTATGARIIILGRPIGAQDRQLQHLDRPYTEAQVALSLAAAQDAPLRDCQGVDGMAPKREHLSDPKA
jgi:hypothetical protein